MRKTLSILLVAALAVGLVGLALQSYAQDGRLTLASLALESSLEEAPLAGVYVHGDYAFVGGMSVGYYKNKNVGVRIVDLSDPGNPELVGRIPLRRQGKFESHTHGDALATHLSTDAFEGDIAIVLDGVPDSFAPADYPQPYGIWDVTDPGNPAFLSVLNLGNSPHGLEGGSLGDKPYDSKAVAGNYFYALYDKSKRTRDFEREGWDDHLAVVDLSDPRNPVVVGDWHDDPAVWLSGVSLNERATRVYVTGFSGTAPDWVGDGYLYVLDIQDPSKPTELGRYVFPTHNVDVSIARPTSDDALVVLADHGWSAPDCGRLHILDTSNPTSIHKISEFALSESSDCGPNRLFIATDVAIRENIVYSTWLKGGVRAIDIADPANPVEVGQFLPRRTPFQAGDPILSDVALLGDDYVVATTVWTSGLYVLRDHVRDHTTIPTRIEEETPVPAQYSLTQNYPNPFNPQTEIHYALPVHSHVRVSVFNTRGQKVATLVEGDRSAGRYALVWDGTDDNGESLASGVYLYRLETDGLVQTRKLMLMR